ncbi:MAG: ribosome maturation factor RimM [Lachnospiraceae bacterium]|nr:ribosome maturation factor RimM [Lachnospiraceae bacterium]MDD3796835.1 ribosome maturation factor RimM [Lachnospiraceae bacterium]
MTDLLQVGAITSTHGLKGEVKVFPTTDDPTRYDQMKEVWLDTGKEKLKLEVERVKYFKQFVIVKFRGLDRIEDIEKYVKKNLYVTRENAVKLQENEYFIADLIGLSVVDEAGEELGILDDVLSTGANDVYVVKKGDNEILIPAIRQCILQVSTEERFMKVHLLEGLV